ncbi:MAG: hypothetical protein PF495_00205 [Spirochaetales bacterium]|jgi:hypothetical protein|nr:hypothetical protein [Spirochaetales bacterium]
MTEYDNRNSGVLFPEKNVDSNRDRNGTAELICPECGCTNQFWVSAWDKVSKAGNYFISLAFSPKEAAKQQQPAKTISKEEQTELDGFDEDIPF